MRRHDLAWAGARLATLPATLFVVLAAVTGAAAECQKLDADLRAAVGAGELDRFAGLHGRMLADPSCDGSYRVRVGRVLALATLLHANDAAKAAGGSIPTEKLRMAASFGQPWQVMTALGDAYYAKELWVAAVRAYEAALDDMRDVSANPKPPPKRIEHRVVKRTYQAKALAPIYVVTRRFRGRPSGLASPKFRNFSVEAVPVPVKFAYNESVLTSEGEKAAADMLAYLNDQNVRKLRLVGHTDPQGSATYNLRLSKARAGSVMRYLIAHGFKGDIDVVGEGERKRFEPDDALKYTEEQRYEFDRRVEYQILD